MKIRLALAFASLALALALLPSLAVRGDLAVKVVDKAATPQQCSAFCARVRCIGEQICGLYTNAAGDTVCGCHPR